MAADTKREVQLDVAVSTSGAESIRALSVDVKALAKNGGDAAPEFQRLAIELDRIAQQADAVEAFSQLQAEISELGLAQAVASERATALRTDLAALGVTTKGYADTEAQALAAVRQSSATLTEKRDELARLKVTYDEAGKQTDQYKTQVRSLNTDILDSRIALREAKAALDAASSSTKQAATDEATLAAQYKVAARESDAANAKLAERNTTLEQSRAALEGAGVSTADLAAAQTKLVAAFAAAQREAGQLQADVVNLARAEKELADTHAFELQAEEAKKLAAAGDYVRLWNELLDQNEVHLRELEQTRVFEQQISNAQKLNAASDYVTFWTEALIKQETVERELANSKAFDKSIADARKLREAAEYVNFWTDALQKAEDEEKRLAETSRRAGQALEDAFKSTGIRSAQAIREEINQIGASLVRLSNNSRVSGADFDRAFAGGQARIEKLKLELAGVAPQIDKATRSTSLFGEGLRNLTAIYGGFELASGFVTANTQIDSLRRTLTLVTGSSEIAGKQIEFLRKTSDDSGVAIGAVSQQYSKFVASAVSAGISLETVNRVFADVTKASGSLGLSSEDTASALNALGQIASKGKVSLEELQQQLGDRLPAVLAVTAKGLGITTAELVKLVENGKLLGDQQFFEAFAQGIEKTFIKGGEKVQGFAAEIARLKNVFNDTFVQIGEAGVVEILVSGMKSLADVVTPVTATLLAMGKALGTVSAAAVDLGGKLVTRDWDGFRAGVRQANDELVSLQVTLASKLPTSLKNLDLFGLRSLGAAEQSKKLADEAKKSADAVGAAGDKAAAGATAHKSLSEATADANVQVTQAGDKWTFLTVQYGKMIDAAKKAAQASEKLVEASKSEGAASIELATIAGNETEKRNAVAAATDKTAEAVTALASAHRSEADLLRIQIGALDEEARSHGTLTEVRKKELDAMRLTLTGKEAEAEKAQAAANNAQAEALGKTLLIKTYGDQSARLNELRVAYEASIVANNAAIAAEKGGIGTKAESAAAARALAAAENLYHDALDDVVRALDRKLERQRQDISVTDAKLSVAKAQLESQLRIAELDGNDTAALDVRIKLKRLEITIIETKVAAQRLEAQAILASAEANKAALEAEGKLTDEKRLAIDASIANARVKQAEADAGAYKLDVLRKEIDNLQQYGDEAGKARGKSTAGLDGETGALARNSAAQDSNTSARQRNAAASASQSVEERNRKIGEDSAKSNADRADLNHTSADNTGIFSLQAKKASGSLSAGDLATAQAVYDAAKANLTTYQQNSTSYSMEGAASAQGDFNSARNILAAVKALAGTSGDATQAGPSSSHTVTITLPNGTTSTVNAASAGDAQALANLLSQLGDAKTRSS